MEGNIAKISPTCLGIFPTFPLSNQTLYPKASFFCEDHSEGRQASVSLCLPFHRGSCSSLSAVSCGYLPQGRLKQVDSPIIICKMACLFCWAENLQFYMLCQVLSVGVTWVFWFPGLPLPLAHIFSMLWCFGFLFLHDQLFQNVVAENTTAFISLQVFNFDLVCQG